MKNGAERVRKDSCHHGVLRRHGTEGGVIPGEGGASTQCAELESGQYRREGRARMAHVEMAPSTPCGAWIEFGCGGCGKGCGSCHHA